MLISRAAVLGRILSNGVKAKVGVRNMSGAWNYREGPKHHSKKTLIAAELAGAAMWWWVLWHLWHEPEHITGEHPYPDVTKWTNKELGIPADDFEE